MNTTITVSNTPGNPADFKTLSEAFAALPDNDTPITITVAPGTYREKLALTRPYVTIIGASPEETVITYDDYGFFLMPDGIKRGTFRSYTFLVNTHDITLKNLTIENPSAPSCNVGQAIALYAEGDHIMAENCAIKGNQDTLFTGPLPLQEYEPGGFRGPTEHAPRINGHQFYKDCYICGDVDFIFGSGTAYFENCTIESVIRQAKEGEDAFPQGYVTAPSTPEGQAYGYVFSHCNFISSCDNETVFLGRPWRDYGQTVVLDSTIGAHINPAGFHDWGKERAHKTLFFGEYNNTGVGASTKKRAAFVTSLTEKDAAKYDKSLVLNGNWWM